MSSQEMLIKPLEFSNMHVYIRRRACLICVQTKFDLHVMPEFTTDQLAEYKRVFARFDKSGDGSITGSELIPLMEYLGLPINLRQFNALLKSVDSNNDGKISFDEFLVMMATKAKTESLAKVFRAADINKDGYLSKEELRNVLQKNGKSVSDNDMERYMAIGDRNGDGKLNYEEFTVLMGHSVLN